MQTFSERMGYKPKKILQLDDVDDDLRNSLWNVFFEFYYKNSYTASGPTDPYYAYIFERFLVDFLKKPLISFNRDLFKAYFFSCSWHEVYSFIEFFPCCHEDINSKNYRKRCNKYLERESSGYRFIENKITPITDPLEIQEIEQAFSANINTEAKKHLDKAIEKFSDKTNPDYENTIKEAISAVESVCRTITDESTLDKSLNIIQNFVIIDPQVKALLEKLKVYCHQYRHGVKEGGKGLNANFNDAKLILVICSAFINYIPTLPFVER